MNLTKLAIKRPVSMLIVVLALVVFGFSAMLGAPLELMPDMEMPAMIILTIYPGAGPEEVNDLVTSVVEDSVSSLSGVKNVTSQSKENMSLVMLEMDYGANMDVAHMDLQEKLDMYKSTLPDDAQTPTIIEVSMDMMPSIVLSANATGDVDLLRLIDDEVKPEFEKLSGVATADVMGGQKDYISVTLNEERLKQYKLDMNTIIGFVGAADFSIPAGSVDRGDQELSLRGGVSYNTVESLKSIPITLSSGQVIRLSDVANIYQGTEESGSISRYNGHETVMVSITKRQSAGTVDVSRAVINTMNRINDSNIGVRMEVINDSSEQILASIKTVFQTLIGAVILCMLVLFLFFRDWRASLIVGSSIPVSVLTTLILMNMMGFSFNVVSLGGLIIGVGMMVDNSIVVLESCFQRQERQLTHREAALEGAKFVTSSIIASTITTIVVFLPISILKGMSGQMFRQLGFTIIFSLTASLRAYHRPAHVLPPQAGRAGGQVRPLAQKGGGLLRRLPQKDLPSQGAGRHRLRHAARRFGWDGLLHSDAADARHRPGLHLDLGRHQAGPQARRGRQNPDRPGSHGRRMSRRGALLPLGRRQRLDVQLGQRLDLRLPQGRP